MDKTISIIYGRDITKMTTTLLEAYSVSRKISSEDASIVIKPNLVTLSDPDHGATTHIEIVEAVICYLQSHSFRNITVAEGSWVGASTETCFNALGYYRLRDKYGIRLLDTKKDRFRKVISHGIEMEISETCLEAEYFINLPVLKGHCQTVMTHAMKNLKGCLSDKSKRDFHRMGLDRPIAALNAVLHTDLTISDSICGDLDFEEGGNPVETDRMMAAENPFLLDCYSATLMGYRPEDIGYIKEAIDIGLLDSFDMEIKELSKPVVLTSKPTGAVKRLSEHTAPADACSACYASLIRALKRLEEEGSLNTLKGKIAIGQGYRGKEPDLGVGACCSKARLHAPGCPPSSDAIYEMIRKLK